MTRRTLWRATLLALWIGCSLPLAAEEPTEWVRQAVLVKTAEVQRREKPDDQAPVVEKPTAALWFYVVEDQDGWLRVDGGWVRSNDEIRKSDAVEHFTAEIQRDASAFAQACRSRAWTDAKEFDKALADADAAILCAANYTPAYFARARAWEPSSIRRALTPAFGACCGRARSTTPSWTSARPHATPTRRRPGR
jgi:hypothetical protein